MAAGSQEIFLYTGSVFVFLLSSFAASTTFAYDNYLDDHLYDRNSKGFVDTNIYAGLGQREGELRWNIASDSSGSKTPNVLSELTYADLSITEAQIGIDLHFNEGMLRNVVIESNIKKGNNDGGTVTDSDYNGNDRTEEYSRSESNPDDSKTLDGKLLLGYKMRWSRSIFVTPMLGYRYNQQSLRMRDGVQILDTRPAALELGPFAAELDSTYEAEWHSAVFGLDTQYRSEKHQLALRWEFILTDYSAEANWNLRSDFAHPKSFAHWANGTGNNIEIHYQYHASSFFSLWVSYRIEDWKTKDGDDVVYFSDGTMAGTQLNEVVWESTATAAGFAFNF